MKIASKFLILIFALLIFMCSCKNKNTALASKPNFIIEKKVICDINKDKIEDTVMLCHIPATLDFFILIKYKLNGQWKEKMINSERNVRAVFFGLMIQENCIRVRYCDEQMKNNSFYILYDKTEDNFLLIYHYLANEKSYFEKSYNIFNGDSIILKINAVSICKKSFENNIIYDTLDEFKKGDKIECIKLPYDKDEKTSEQVEKILEVPLDTPNVK